MKGLVHIYCGDGKGKTTAAMGLAIRCAGAGEKVLVFQFLKGNTSSERKILEEIKNITLLEGYPDVKFSYKMTEQDRQEITEYYKKRFEDIMKMLKCGEYRLVLLDEIIATVNLGFLDENVVVDFLKSKPEALEVVLTGREPSDNLLELADYITEMKKIKHPYEQGIRARKSIEY